MWTLNVMEKFSFQHVLWSPISGLIQILLALHRMTSFPQILHRLLHPSLLHVCLQPTKAQVERRKLMEAERNGDDVEPSQEEIETMRTTLVCIDEVRL